MLQTVDEVLRAAVETSYRVGNADGNNPEDRAGWLWVVGNQWVRVFDLRLSRSAEVAQQLIGAN